MQELQAKYKLSKPEQEQGPLSMADVAKLKELLTHLYVGNLVPETSEQLLARLFSKYGELEQVKVMAPRSEEDKKRRRNCAFIKFEKYESAYLAKEELNEKQVKGQGMKIGWGKGIG